MAQAEIAAAVAKSTAAEQATAVAQAETAAAEAKSRAAEQAAAVAQAGTAAAKARTLEVMEALDGERAASDAQHGCRLQRCGPHPQTPSLPSPHGDVFKEPPLDRNPNCILPSNPNSS